MYDRFMRRVGVIAGAAFVVSFAAKLLADAFLTERVALIGGFAGLLPSRNPGIAFGLRLPDIVQTPVILLAIALLAWAARKAETTLVKTGFGLLLGGAVGNAVDRLRDGYVTDFFQVGSFPIFNVADSCISVGVALLVIDGFLALLRRPRTRAA